MATDNPAERLDRIESQQDFLLGQSFFLLWAMAVLLRRLEWDEDDVRNLLADVEDEREQFTQDYMHETGELPFSAQVWRGYERFQEGLAIAFRHRGPQ